MPGLVKSITEWTRICPQCKNMIYYKSKRSWYNMRNSIVPCLKCTNKNKCIPMEQKIETSKKGSLRFKQKNRDFLFEYLESHPCVDCGETEKLVLDFDHDDPIDKFDSIGSLTGRYSLKILKKEVKKCTIRCGNCHRLKTKKRLRKDGKLQQYKIKYNISRYYRRQYENRCVVENYLETHPCMDCGEDNIDVLEFDHIVGIKKKSISKMVAQRNSISTIKAELKKCEIRCVNCHRRKTSIQLNWRVL